MKDGDSPVMLVLTAIAVVRGTIGYLVLLGVTFALLIMGNTLARIIGVVFLAVCLLIARRLLRDRRSLNV